MRKLLFLLLAFGALSTCALSQQTKLPDWISFIKANRCQDARQMCTPLADSTDPAAKADAQKCLANVALCGHDMMQLQGDDAGGGTLGGSYAPEAVDEALVHLNLGIQLAPQDLSIHQGRLHILEVSARYSDMVKTLDESCSIYHGSDAPQAWLDYSVELMDLRQYAVGLDFMKVLDKHYPNSPDILGNIGAFLDLLKRDSEAIPYLQKAAALAPKDPINAWDLARAYDYSDQIALADQWYQKALSLESEHNRFAEMSCMYGKFVDQKLRDRKRACQLEKINCGDDDRTACKAEPSK